MSFGLTNTGHSPMVAFFDSIDIPRLKEKEMKSRSGSQMTLATSEEIFLSAESEKLNPKKLQSLSPFLKLDKIRPGDVLLTRGRAAHSTFIAKATRGEFSHAAIFLPVENSPWPFLVEADGFGVGFTHLPLVFLSVEEFRTITVYSIPNSPLTYKLLRHPEIENKSSEQLYQAASELQAKVLHRRYSILSRLIKPVDLPDNFKDFTEKLIRLTESRIDASSHTGVFCSELVAMYFDALGVPLFEKQRSIQSVSPNHLDESASLLKEVPDAFVDLSKFRHIEGELSNFRFWERKEVLPVFVRQRQDSEVTIRQKEEFEACLMSNIAEISIACLKESQHIYENIIQSANLAGYSGKHGLVDRFLSFANKIYLSNHIEIVQQSYERDQQFSGSEVPFEERVAWTQAFCKLTELISSLRSTSIRAYTRTDTLLAVTLIRNQLEDKKISMRTRLSLKRKRRALLREYRSYKASFPDIDLFVDKLKTKEPLTDKSFGLIEKIILEAKIAAIMELGIDPDSIPENSHLGEMTQAPNMAGSFDH
jgi:hypothetical protein